MLKLGKQGDAPVNTPAPVVTAAVQANGVSRPQPKGWGASAAAETQDTQPSTARPTFGQRSNATADVIEQRAAVTEKLTQRQNQGMDQPHHGHDRELAQEEAPAAVRGAAQFSRTVIQQLEAPKGEADQMAKEVDATADAKPKRSRAPKSEVNEVSAPWHDPEALARQLAQEQRFIRQRALELALQYVEGDAQHDPVEVAQLFADFINGVPTTA